MNDTDYKMNQLSEAISILRELVDENPCSFDHHGNCQEHGWTNYGEGLCPHERAKRLLFDVDEEVSPMKYCIARVYDLPEKERR